jgi:hypothetical protein
LSVKPTTEGVSLEPEEFIRTFGEVPSITATTEFVVPKSIPIILAMFKFLSPFYSFIHKDTVVVNVQKLCQLLCEWGHVA